MNVRLSRVDPRRTLEQFPAEIQRKVNGNANVRRDEIIDVPGAKGVEAVEDDDDAEEDEREPGRVGLEGRFEDERIAVDALGFESFVEL